MSDTPRTDAQVILATFPEAEVVCASFARQLEREQVMAHDRRKALEIEVEKLNATILTLRGDLHAERVTNEQLARMLQEQPGDISSRRGSDG